MVCQRVHRRPRAGDTVRIDGTHTQRIHAGIRRRDRQRRLTDALGDEDVAERRIAGQLELVDPATRLGRPGETQALVVNIQGNRPRRPPHGEGLFQYEVAVVVQDGMRRMFAEQEDVYYYLTVMNENYEHPEMPEGAEADIIKGMYAFRKGGEGDLRVQLLGSGTIFNEVIAAAELLKNDWGVEADIWGCPSFNELARDGQDAARWNLLHPLEAPRKSHVEQKLEGAVGPVIAATDYIRLFAEQIRPYVKGRYVTLGTDGFGRSDTREKLRHFFEVDRRWVTLAALKALADEGKIERDKVAAALVKYKLDPSKPNPMSV